MATQPISFADVTTAITTLATDFTASNTAIQGQLGEVKQLLIDFLQAVQTGTGPTQADLQAAIQQVTSIDTAVQASTTAITASTAAITAADPNAGAPPPPPPPPAA